MNDTSFTAQNDVQLQRFQDRPELTWGNSDASVICFTREELLKSVACSMGAHEKLLSEEYLGHLHLSYS